MINKFSYSPSFKHRQQFESSSPSLAQELINLWMNEDINDSYQEIVLQYLDKLPISQAHTQIAKQLKKVNQHTTYYHKIMHLLTERDRILLYLQNLTTEFNNFKINKNKNKPNLQQICDLVDLLRKVTMSICQEVTAMFQSYGIHPDRESCNVGSYYMKLFQDFNNDIFYLRESFLAYYIPFSESYDPLFLEPTKCIQKLYQQNKIVYDKNVAELFRLNASYMYRLLRAHQKIVQYLELSSKLNENVEFDYNSRPILSLTENVDIKQEETIQNVNQSQTNKNKKLQINNLQPIKAKSFIQIELNKRKSLQNIQKKPLTKVDKRAIVHCEPLVIFISGKKSRKSISKPSLNESRLEESTFPEKLKDQVNRTIQEISTEHTTQDYRPFNKKMIANTTKSKSLSKTQNKDNIEINTINSRVNEENNSKTAHSTQKMVEAIQQRCTQCRTLIKKHSKRFKLPNVSRVKQYRHNYKQEDCLCRQKYRNRTIAQSCELLSEKDYEESRKTIIREIREKYKIMAQKEIRYELSKLGDPIYHQMKGRMTKNRLSHNHNNRFFNVSKTKQQI